MKVFKIYWLDGSVETIRGNDIADAVKKAGIGRGATKAIDHWSEVKVSPLDEKMLLIDGEEVINPKIVTALRNELSINTGILRGSTIKVNIYNRDYTFRLIGKDNLSVSLSTIKQKVEACC